MPYGTDSRSPAQPAGGRGGPGEGPVSWDTYAFVQLGRGQVRPRSRVGCAFHHANRANCATGYAYAHAPARRVEPATLHGPPTGGDGSSCCETRGTRVIQA